MKLVIATRNRHKLKEIKAIFRFPGLEIAGMDEFPGIPEVVEDGDTFEANAAKKAVAVARASGHWSMADDSGLEVRALNGAPGVRSARYAGEPVSYPANNKKLLDEMKNVTDRRACFRCAIALSDAKGSSRVVSGRCEGRLIHECRGKGGFGYDPLFVPDGHDKTFAEMNENEKNGISHRGTALARAKEEWGELLSRL